VVVGALGLVIGPGLTGCGHKEPGAQQGDGSAQGNNTEAPGDPRLRQSFAEATLADPPAGVGLPPETTVTGKSVGKLYTEVSRLWDGIRFVSPGGKPLAYHAALDTEMGTIDIALRPDLAPNQVRSFIALARAGYYDGLVFERTIHEENRDGRLEQIEAGCPLGTGEIGQGGIGYWLKPEKNSHATHEEGTVGASHGPETDAGTCKFYINLCQTPAMDGDYTVFGKVTQGLDIARRILSLPLSNEAPEGDRPARPVVIRKVIIEASEVEN
jgi:cyclophilin family peptidyl-prolyl cis-trans isomerase